MIPPKINHISRARENRLRSSTCRMVWEHVGFPKTELGVWKHILLFSSIEKCVCPQKMIHSIPKRNTRKHTFWDTHAIEKNWIIGVIRWELNPKTCN